MTKKQPRKAPAATGKCALIRVMYGGGLSATIQECTTHRYPDGSRMLVGSPGHRPYEAA